MEKEVNDEIVTMIKHMEEKMNEMERLVRLSLVMNVMNELDLHELSDENEDIKLSDFVESFRLQIVGIYEIGTKKAVLLQSDDKMNIKRIRSFYGIFMNEYENMIPVFVFAKVSWNQKKKLEEEHISYYIKEKEVHVIA